MLRHQFQCYALKALSFIKIAIKLSYFCQKLQNFRALRAPPPNPYWPPAAGGSAPRPTKQPSHCEFLATRLIGGDANVDYTQTVGGDTVKLLGRINPPIPPRCRHPCVGLQNHFLVSDHDMK